MQTIKDQFDAMLDSGVIPAMEYQIKNYGGNDWLLVDIGINDRGVTFSFDSMEKPTYFDGEIITYNDCYYCLPFDEYFEDLDYYLQAISDNITEGFLLPNDLYYVDDNEA